jgi:small subunit ribosomal protein S20
MNKKQKNKKSILQNKRNRMINRRYSTTVKTLGKLLLLKWKNYQLENEEEKKKTVQEEIQQIRNSFYSIVDKGVKKKVFHKNTAARKKSRMGLLFSLSSV